MTTSRTGTSWLDGAVLYQIYPQSFADSDGDGIGDFAGITERLGHLSWLGVNTIWINPCFVSPFRDAGYDVSDYFRVAPRYGTDDDLAALVEAARGHGIRVLLDLVAGHTSDEHPWFLHSADDPSDHRYIWTDGGGPAPRGFVPSPGSRPGAYLPNFFESQPALNFGYAREKEGEPWRQPVDAEGPRANRAALCEIMDHWLRLGLAGFRVDMASSLVKDDPGLRETVRLWTELRGWLDRTHPEAVIMAEWGDPAVSVPAGFHVDFFLQFGGENDGLPMRSLWNNGQGTVLEHWDPLDCFFDAGGGGSPRPFIEAWREATSVIGGSGHVSLPTSNHDFARLACGARTREQLPAAFVLQMTWPTLPAIYYGDEIGMRYIPDLPDVEGSRLGPRYNRAGSRTPMQWDAGPNAGFSTAAADRLYLPLDPDPGRPDVATQRADPDSLLNLVRRLIALRAAAPELRGGGEVEILNDGFPFAYVRGGRYLVVVNPRREPAVLPLPRADLASARPVESGGVALDADSVKADAFSYGIFEYAAGP
ncbi:alpha-amylase family glycosyl hydrolase [Spirillospora sp. NPDC029432]|uniref:alpha-amylase family glycosyl hydrolase n=1 Tax=Spirillospora sp. NPDC029432 TaxID=3154599 RepID=UPI003455CBF6